VPKSASSPSAPNGTDVVNSSASPVPLVQLAMSRQATVDAPVPAHWYYGKSEAEVNALLDANQARLTSLQVESLTPPRFTVSMVQNVGCYAKKSTWYYDQTEAQMSALIYQQGARLADVDAYVRDDGGQKSVYFAGILEDNSDADSTAWWWWYGYDVGGISDKLGQYQARLVALREYVAEDGSNLYAAVMYDNTGPNATMWWWYVGQSQADIQALLMQNQSYLVYLTPTIGSTTTFDVVMYADPGFKWSWYQGETPAQLGALDPGQWRIANVKSYFAGDQRLLTAIAVDNQ
jgi:hypothetical protein